MSRYDPSQFSEYLSCVGGSDDDDHYDALAVLHEHAELTREPLLQALCSAGSEFTRSRAATVLSGMAHPDVEQALLHCLQHEPSDIVRDAAVLGLRELTDASATPVMLAGLGDRSPIVRRFCAQILGHLGGTAVIPRLVQALQNHDEWTAYHAASSLRRWENPEARTTLERLRDHALEPSVRTCARQALWEWDQKPG